MSEPTLNEFLLARLEEDEAAAWISADDPRQWWARRDMHECEAKRRIVARFRGLAESSDINTRVDARATLRDLASVYADHPDYDEAWRA